MKYLIIALALLPTTAFAQQSARCDQELRIEQTEAQGLSLQLQAMQAQLQLITADKNNLEKELSELKAKAKPEKSDDVWQRGTLLEKTEPKK